MNIQELDTQLDYLEETKDLIKQAIIDKGQEIGENDTFRSYVDKIAAIQTGGAAYSSIADFEQNGEVGEEALIIDTSFKPINTYVYFNKIKYPRTFTTTSRNSLYLSAEDYDDNNNKFSNGYVMQFSGSNRAYAFYVDKMGNTNYIAEYSSSDGMTYTRIDEIEEDIIWELPTWYYTSNTISEGTGLENCCQVNNPIFLRLL